MGPNMNENFKTYPYYNRIHMFSNLSWNAPHQITLFLTFWVPIFYYFFVSNISNLPLYPKSQKPQLSGNRVILVHNGVTQLRPAGSSSTYMGYLWPCNVQGNLGVIRCTSHFFRKYIFFQNAALSTLMIFFDHTLPQFPMTVHTKATS